MKHMRYHIYICHSPALNEQRSARVSLLEFNIYFNFCRFLGDRL